MALPTLTEIYGQTDALEVIRRAYLADRLPHGLVFAGPVGVGKATTAAALAGLFLCEKPSGAVPCGKCESCRVFAAGTHPDYHVITKQLIRYHDKTGKSKGIDLSIHVIRPELVEPAGRKANMGHGKVFIVEQAERMNAQAQNSILKTLEEPAGRTLIILLTDTPGALLDTIRSRCQVVRFASLSQQIVRDQLQHRGIDAAIAADAARLSEGSVGIALQWIEDGVIDAARQLTQQLDGVLNGRPAAGLASWFRSAADAYAEKQIERDELGSKDQAMREGLLLYLRLTANHFRATLAISDDAVTLNRACGVIEAIAPRENYLDANVNVPLIFQQLTSEMEQQYGRAGRGAGA